MERRNVKRRNLKMIPVFLASETWSMQVLPLAETENTEGRKLVLKVENNMLYFGTC